MYKKIETFFIYIISYASAILASYFFLTNWLNEDSVIVRVFYADLIGSSLIFLNCIAFNSFSLYDPYWTVQATCISLYYFIILNTSVYDLRSVVVLVLVNVWSIRLTYNLFSTAIEDVKHEDWRYSSFRSQWGSKISYFTIGYFSFILMPTIIVFFGCTPMYYVFTSSNSINMLDFIAFLVTVMGIVFESVGDYQLTKELSNAKNENKLPCMDKGLWSLCRHPNYFGEISFWFGICIFGLAAGASLTDKFYLVVFLLGSFSVLILIYFGSMPLMEERQLKRRTVFYKDYMQKVPFKILPFSNLKRVFGKNKSAENLKKSNQKIN